MGARLLEIGVVIVTVLSAGLLALLLAAPLMPQPSAMNEAPSSTPLPSASALPEDVLPQMGLFLMRNPFSLGPCLALELEAQSYPVAGGVEGTATVLWWQRGMTGCDGRTGEVETVEARTHVVPDSTDPDGAPIGYTLEFSMPLFDFNLGPMEDEPPVHVSLTILTRQSTDTVLQAIEEAPGSGQGYVLDRVPAVDPPLNPLPTPVAAAGGPTGLYLLSGPFTVGACVAIELTSDAYPVDPAAPGTATILWWEHAGSDPDDPTVCYSRVGDIQEAAAVVIARGVPAEYAVRFSAPLPGTESDELEFAIVGAASNRDQLQAVRVTPAGTEPMVFDRVDELNPPLASPGPSAGP
jgi:hypothetical protein